MGFSNSILLFTTLAASCIIFSATPLHAQNATIKGQLLDLPNAINISLIQHTPRKAEQRILTDASGNFQFKALEIGKYQVSAMHIGFEHFVSDTIHVSDGAGIYTIYLKLKSALNRLQEVEIISTIPSLEAKNGRLIFNVGNSVLNAGKTAFDVLKNIPGISIGQNDEILFRGASGIHVAIGGKMTYLSGLQLANYLKGLSGQELNRIELITAPTAEFDAAGSSGVINFVLNKSLKEGYAVDLRSSVSKGKEWMHNQNIASSFRRKRWGINGMFDFKTPDTYSTNISGNSITEQGKQLTLLRDNIRHYKIDYYTWSVGGDWQFDPRHKISVAYNGYLDDFKSYNYSIVEKLNSLQKLESSIQSSNVILEPYSFNAFNINYQFDIDSIGKRIRVDLHTTSYQNLSDGLMTTKNYLSNGDFDFEHIQKSHQPGFVHINSVQMDADFPYKILQLKFGLKYAEVENDNKYTFEWFKIDRFVEDEFMSNHFKYKERIAAAYFSGAVKMGDTHLLAGLRSEYTGANGHDIKGNLKNKWKYIKFFPSLSIEQILSQNHKLDFSVSRRINRPSYSDLNPVRWYSDAYFYFSGNPELTPELAWIFNLTYSLKSKYFFTAVFNKNLNYINRRLAFDENGTAIRSQSVNLGTRNRLDLTASTPVQLTSFWGLQLFSNLSYTSYPISHRSGFKTLNRWSSTFSLQQNISINKTLKMNVAVLYYSPELRGVYLTRPSGWVDFGVRKAFLNNNLDVQFSLSDVFDSKRFWAFSQSDVINYYYKEKPASRIFTLSVRYHLGTEVAGSSVKETEEQKRL